LNQGFSKKKKKSKIELSHLPIKTERLEWIYSIYCSNNRQGSEDVSLLLLQPMYRSLGKDIRLFCSQVPKTGSVLCEE